VDTEVLLGCRMTAVRRNRPVQLRAERECIEETTRGSDDVINAKRGKRANQTRGRMRDTCSVWVGDERRSTVGRTATMEYKGQ